MSDQPPFGYGGQHGCGQQWPPSYTPMVPLNYPPKPDHPSQTHLPPSSLGQPFEYKMAGYNATGQAPGYGGQGLFYPPHVPYMHNFDPSLTPLHVPPVPMPPYGSRPFGPSLPAAPPPPATLNSRAQAFSQSSGLLSRGRGDSSTREEGEISEGGRSVASKGDGNSGKHGRSQRACTTRHSDLEEGETMATKSQNSSRSSSPYNPPLSVSADADVVNRAIEMQKQDVSAAPSESSQAPKSAAQLRLQALGAILSLAPHNIRYEQLVAEGINPAVLKKLYEEVGIKITPDDGQKMPAACPAPAKPSDEPSTHIRIAGSGQSATSQKQGEPNKPAVQKPTLTTSSASVSTPALPDSSKPIERKELIARKLAAKAAKAAEEPVSNAKPKEAQSPASATITPSTELQSKPSSFPVREKNKAQTELARQRIEELKRQALLKKQQQAQSPSQSDKSATEDHPIVPSSAVQHPLPVRPPVPQSSSRSVIPGLSMTAPQQQSDAPSPGGIAVDSTPVTRASHRKRPRASDFDEPETALGKRISHTPNRPDSAEKLIIDISEDESLYGDDEGEDMDIDSSPEQGASPVEPSERPSLQKRDSDTGASASTPHGTVVGTAPDHMRHRELEIQAMHRKIAELERKRREKLAASRTQSPRNLEDSAISSSVAHSSVADAEVAEASTAPSSGPKVASTASTTVLADRPNLTSNDSVDDGVIPDAPVSASTSLDSSSSSSSEPESLSKEAAEIEAINEGEEPSASPQEGSPSSAMAESVGIESSAEASSEEEEESEVSDVPVEAVPISAPNPEAMAIDAPHQSVPPAPATTGNVDSGRDDQSCESSGDNMELSEESEAHEASEGQPAAASGASAAASFAPSESQVQEHQDDRDSAVSSAESDVYEPPEPGSGVDSTKVADSPPFSPAPPVSVELPPSQGQPPAAKELMDAPQASASESRSVFGLLGSQAPSSRAEKKFSSYVSPLRNFKAYRYHPNYAEHVSDGYRSLTYSHNIDPMTCLCPYELAGGVCNDRSCEFQHFRDMTLDDDKILIQMGAIREGQTEEEKEAYLAGLKEIINEMRRDKVKDFHTVATEIAAYRRRFLQDPSRVLPL